MNANHELRIRLTASQKAILHDLAMRHGYPTMSDYARAKLFGEDDLHAKLDSVLALLQNADTPYKKSRPRR